MQESGNFVITDAALQAAAEEVAMAMLLDVPAESHTFSARFEKKMKRLLRRTRHPVGYRVLRYAAAILLAITVLFGAVFAASPEVRAAVVNWVKSAFHEFFRYSSNETLPPEMESVEYEFFLPESFGDYSLVTTFDEEKGKTFIFMSNQGELLQFTYAYGGETSMYVDAENTDVYKGMVGEQSADIYISKNGSETNAIVWQDPESNVLLVISVYADIDELQKIAENVEKREIPPN